MWRQLLVIMVLLCVVALVGCAGSALTPYGGDYDRDTLPPDHSPGVPDRPDADPIDGPPAPPVF